MKLATDTHRIKRIFIFLAAMLLPLAALAGGTATIQTSGDTMQIAWQDDGAVRIDTAGKSAYMIGRNGKLYSVRMENGQPQVIDMTGMIKMLAAVAGKSGDMPTPFGQIDSITATGDSATVAGIEGRVYKVTVTDSDGQTETRKTVLTDDPLVVAMTQTYVDALLGALAPKVAASLNAKLPADDRGLLRSGDGDFVLIAISGEEPDASLFKLPAKPKDMGNLIQMMIRKSQQ